MKKQPYVVFVTKLKMLIAGGPLKEVVTVEFAREVMRDLEISNMKSLDNQLLSIIEMKNLKPDQVVFLLHEELYFTQEFAAAAEEEVKNYLSLIPFDNVQSKRLQTPTGQRVVATSDDLISPLVEVFTRHRFEVIAVCPSLVLGESLKTEEQFTPELVASLLHSFETVLVYSLYIPPKPQENMTSIRNAEGKIFSPRLILMIVFFTGLIGVLVALLYMNGYFGNKKTPSVVTPPTEQIIETVPTISPVQTESIATESGAINTSTESAQPIQPDLRIEVLNGSSVVGQADDVEEALTQAGFRQITTQNTSSSGQRTLILYNPRVSRVSLQAIVQALDSIEIQSSAQENSELTTVDVRIITGS